jgi:outer membrane protein OmpA-like peptidoglycan-associated protein
MSIPRIMERITRRFSTGLLLLAVLVAPSIASAQGSVTLDQFHPAETGEDGFALSRPDDRGHLRFGAQLALDYAFDPLVFQPSPGSTRGEIEVVRNELVAHLGVHLGLFDRLVLFAGMPFIPLMEGASAMPGLAYASADGPGLGDTLLGARVRVYGERSDVFALALQATFTLPTAQWSQSAQRYSGERGGMAIPEVLAELRFAGFRITLNLGARLRFTDEAIVQTLHVGHELTWAGGVTIPIVDQAANGIGLTGHLEAFGATTFASFGARETTPVDLLAGLRVEPVCGLFVGLAGGAGVARGYGSPDARGLLTVGFSDSHCSAPSPVEAPPSAVVPPSDRDHDGVNDDVDACPDQPEDPDAFEDEDGCPDLDNDGDGVPDVSDGAPLEPEDPDGFEDEDGVPDPDDDHDGVLDASDACPRVAEDVDTFEDENGCPDPDNDGDGVLDVDDACPLVPGTLRAQGCPETARIDEATGTIVIFQRVEFSTSRDRIVERSFPILQEVADLLAAHPEVTQLRIEGHTDDRGRDGANLDLSRRRAASVVRWLVAHGIDAGRLAAWGCGELHPIETNGTREGRQDNRRVEFHVLTPTPPSGPRAPEGCVEAIVR